MSRPRLSRLNSRALMGCSLCIEPHQVQFLFMPFRLLRYIALFFFWLEECLHFHLEAQGNLTLHVNTNN